MPAGLINRLNEEEVKNLLTYLMSGGSKEHPLYQEKAGKGAP